MPSFTGQVPDLSAVGPVVEVAIGPARALVNALEARGESIPAPVRIAAMIDTGASGTVIQPSVIEALGIQPVGVVQMSTPSTQKPVDALTYNVSVVFPNGVTVSDVVAIQAPLGGQNIQCLIGRDILRHGVLVYIGYVNQFTLSF